MNFFQPYFDTLHACLGRIDPDQLLRLSGMLRDMVASDRKVVVVGNGGSAAIASHVSIDLTKAAGIRTVNFNEAALITCLANDYGYENWVAEAIDRYAGPQDLAILISSSGQSRNMINGARAARSGGLCVVTFTGFSPDNPLRGLGDLNIWVDSRAYNVVELAHQASLLSIVDHLVSTRAQA